MSVRVEFLGMPRRYADCDSVNVNAETLGETLMTVATQLPKVAEHCIDGHQMRPGYLAAINCRVFTVDPTQRLADGDTVQILSSDVGGH